MIRCQNDHRVLQAAAVFEIGKQPTQLIVALLDQSHVGRDYLLADLFFLKGLRNLIALIGAKHRMGVILLDRVALGGGHMAGVIHIVIGRWHDIGPMRFDITDMGHPRRLSIPRLHEFDRLAGQPRRFAMFFGNIGRFIGILEDPTAGNLFAIHTSIGKISPWVLRLVALRFEIFIVG